MKYLRLFLTSILFFCSISAKAKVSDMVELLYSKFPDVDKVCFLLGTVNETDTDSGSVTDTMVCRRIAGYNNGFIESGLARFVRALFEHDFPDLRLSGTCPCSCSLQKYYGRDVQIDEHGFVIHDTVCKDSDTFRLELFSLPLAKIIAGYLNYRGVINKKKITGESQKLSFLTGMFFSGLCREVEGSEKYNDRDKRYYYAYQVFTFNSPETVKTTMKFLKELGCKHVRCVDKNTSYQSIVFTPSPKVLEKNLYSFWIVGTDRTVNSLKVVETVLQLAGNNRGEIEKNYRNLLFYRTNECFLMFIIRTLVFSGVNCNNNFFKCKDNE
jgi:hypothetical protein